MSIELKTKKIDPEKDFKMSEQQTIDAEEALEASLELQKKLGLGNSSKAGERLLTGCKAAKAVKSLIKDFRFIDEPDEEKMPRFQGGPIASSSRTFDAAPKYAMVRLVEGVEAITCKNASRSDFNADLPIIPLTVLSLASKVKEVAPKAELHLIFEPEWKKQPQRDPVLVAKISDNYWCEIGHWGSDADAIRMMLEDKAKS